MAADNAECRWRDYEERLARVLAHIHDHLDEDLDLNRLADVACLSPYHWHRIYHGMLGETAAATVRRVRLHRAAGHLVQTRMRFGDIAAACGFNSVQAFSRVFRAAFRVTPGEYRRLRRLEPFATSERKHFRSMYEITIRHIAPATAWTTAHLGPYMQIGKAFDRLSGVLAARNLFQPGIRMVALYYDDPAAVSSELLRSRAGVIFPGNNEVDVPLDRTPIAGGDYAVLRHKGPYAELQRAYQWLYGQWLPQSGREPADDPVFEEYFNTPRDTPPAELITGICLPLRS